MLEGNIYKKVGGSSEVYEKVSRVDIVAVLLNMGADEVAVKAA